MTRTLLAAIAAGAFVATASAQTYVTPVYPSSYRTAWPGQGAGTYNYHNPLYHGLYPPTGYYLGGYVSSQAYTNAGDTIPTTYITHYRSLPVVEVPVVTVPVAPTVYTEVRTYEYYPPVYRSGRGRWR